MDLQLPMDVWQEIIRQLINHPRDHPVPYKLYFIASVSKAHHAIVKPLMWDSLRKLSKLASFPGRDNLHLCYYFVRNGYLSCLKYAHESGCKWHSGVLNSAVKANQFECFKYMYENGCPTDQWTTAAFQRSCDPRFYQFAIDNGFDLDIRAYLDATYRGSLECIKFLHERGYDWDPNAPPNEDLSQYEDDPWLTNIAAKRGSLDCLKYLIGNGYPCSSTTCYNAALGGHLDCLKYLHESGCPWDIRTTTAASEKRQYSCLQYAIENGCPYSVLFEKPELD